MYVHLVLHMWFYETAYWYIGLGVYHIDIGLFFFFIVCSAKINDIKSIYGTFQKTSLSAFQCNAPPKKQHQILGKNTLQTCRIQPEENLKQHTLTLINIHAYTQLVCSTFVLHTQSWGLGTPWMHCRDSAETCMCVRVRACMCMYLGMCV